jgi:serine/threonine protein phosphatase PrpC
MPMLKRLVGGFARWMRRLVERLERYAARQPDGADASALSTDELEHVNATSITEEMSQNNDPVWYVIGKSVEGASHTRAELPNQDAIESLPESGPAETVIMAVSDGHGGAKYFRSEKGAQLAVEIATRFLQKLVNGESGGLDGQRAVAPQGSAREPVEEQQSAAHGRFDKITREIAVPQGLVREWTEAVKKHLAEHEIKASELGRLDEKEHLAYSQCARKYEAALARGSDSQALREDKDFLEWEAKLIQAYGATLLAVVVAESYVVYWQLGDGDILNISSHGKASHVMPKDERLFANETTSLCTAKAWRDFRAVFQPLPEEQEQRPALIMLSTDGYSNSYSSPQGFERVGVDLLTMMREEEGKGVEKVESSLEQWLKETSEGGSGDDISAGLILRIAALQERHEAEAEEVSTLAEEKPEAETPEPSPLDAITEEAAIAAEASNAEEPSVAETPQPDAGHTPEASSPSRQPHAEAISEKS